VDWIAGLFELSLITTPHL